MLLGFSPSLPRLLWLKREVTFDWELCCFRVVTADMFSFVSFSSFIGQCLACLHKSFFAHGLSLMGHCHGHRKLQYRKLQNAMWNMGPWGYHELLLFHNIIKMCTSFMPYNTMQETAIIYRMHLWQLSGMTCLWSIWALLLGRLISFTETIICEQRG